MKKTILLLTFFLTLSAGFTGCGHGPGTSGKGRRYVVHTVTPGETLSQIAMQYYGTYKKYNTLERILQFNRLDDPRSLQAGQRLRIPVLTIDGVSRPGAGTAAKKTPPPASSPPPEPEEIRSPALTQGIEALNSGKYREAVSLFKKVLHRNPGDTAARNYLGTAYLLEAEELYQRGEYSRAREGFEQARRYRPDCDECDAHLERISDKGEEYIRAGIRLFERREYGRAIAALENGRTIVPDDRRLQQFLFQASFEEALRQFMTYQSTRNPSDLRAARHTRKSALQYRDTCEVCSDYEQKYMQKNYNEGIKLFTDQERDGLVRAVRIWERIQFLDPDYRQVGENIRQGSVLLKKLEEMEKGKTEEI